MRFLGHEKEMTVAGGHGWELNELSNNAKNKRILANEKFV